MRKQESVLRKELHMPQQTLPRQISLLLAIGSVLVFRSVLHTDVPAFGIDLVGLAGLACLIGGLILASRLSRRINLRP
jgi:hypothetical protein